MPALMIGPIERAMIADIIRQATEHPLDLAEMKRRLAGQPPPGERGNPTIVLPVGYGVTFTIEEQPPPTGMTRHISISVDRPGKLPSIEAMNMILEEFGFVNRVGRLYTFLEDIGDGDKAINCIEPLDGDMTKVPKRGEHGA